MKMRWIIAGVIALLALLFPVVVTGTWVGAAEDRLTELESIEAGAAPQVAIAQEANEDYCTPELKQILRRVLLSCGLIGGAGGRGCQPVEARNVATMSGDDFNALFLPMRERGGIVQYERASADLDPSDFDLIDRVFADRRGASYFLVVSRASPEGAVETNRDLSHRRAEAVMTHLQERFADPELERQVGLLWLGAEYAQLDTTFCDWSRSAEECRPEDINRSAFIAWIDCRL